MPVDMPTVPNADIASNRIASNAKARGQQGDAHGRPEHDGDRQQRDGHGPIDEDVLDPAAERLGDWRPCAVDDDGDEEDREGVDLDPAGGRAGGAADEHERDRDDQRRPGPWPRRRTRLKPDERSEADMKAALNDPLRLGRSIPSVAGFDHSKTAIADGAADEQQSGGRQDQLRLEGQALPAPRRAMTSPTIAYPSPPRTVRMPSVASEPSVVGERGSRLWKPPVQVEPGVVERRDAWKTPHHAAWSAARYRRRAKATPSDDRPDRLDDQGEGGDRDG